MSWSPSCWTCSVFLILLCVSNNLNDTTVALCNAAWHIFFKVQVEQILANEIKPDGQRFIF